MKPDSAIAKTRAARRTAVWGCVVLFIGILLVTSPLLLGPGSPLKYIVAVGFLAVCLGLNFILHGLWDWFQERRR